ncbi:MAG: ribonuclease Z [Saprospiraceae bacterium]|nr:ribonuclease Z [Saprospiraceae bacterium]MCB9318299.1 ribonuclease Z [Lewinellaceae bacterium]
MEVTILGNNSAVPAHQRHPTSQVIKIKHHSFLLDCGEGTQMRMIDYSVKRGRIHHIFISHLHGDHFFGLPGVVTSFNHMGRKDSLHIYGPKGLKAILDLILEAGDVPLQYSLHFHELESGFNLLVRHDDYEVWSFPMQHRIPTWGFIFKEVFSKPNVIKAYIDEYGLTIANIKDLKAGNDIQLPDERWITVREATSPPPPPNVYAYCSDTLYDETLVPLIRGADTLYHESTFTEEFEEKAMLTKHSTAAQAAQIAVLAEVQQLLLGHYSSRFGDLTPLLEEARAIFPNTQLSIEGQTYSIVKGKK